MNATLTPVTKTRTEIAVTVPADEAAKARAAVVREFAAQAALPGFRKGKAPAALVEKAYADRIDREAAERTVRDAYGKAVEENRLDVFEIVSIDDRATAPDGTVTFKAVVDLVPTFELPALDGIPVDDADTAVTDEQVQEQSDGFLRSQGTFVDLEADRAAAAEDMLQIDYTATTDGKPLAEAVPDAATFAEKKGAWCTVGSEYFTVPGLPKMLEGRKVGDAFEAEVEFPQDFYKESLRGVKATYSVTVSGGRRFVLPALDEALLKRVGAASEEELRARIRSNLEASAKTADRARRLDQVASHLAKAADFELPAAALERETEGLLSNLLRYNMDKGVSKEDLSKERDRLSAAARERAEANLRVDFVVEAIRRARGIELSNEEFTAFLNRVVREQRLSEAQIKELSKNRMALRSYHRAAVREKVLSALLEKAAPTPGLKA